MHRSARKVGLPETPHLGALSTHVVSMYSHQRFLGMTCHISLNHRDSGRCFVQPGPTSVAVSPRCRIDDEDSLPGGPHYLVTTQWNGWAPPGTLRACCTAPQGMAPWLCAVSEHASYAACALAAPAASGIPEGLSQQMTPVVRPAGYLCAVAGTA